MDRIGNHSKNAKTARGKIRKGVATAPPPPPPPPEREGQECELSLGVGFIIYSWFFHFSAHDILLDKLTSLQNTFMARYFILYLYPY